MRISSTNVLALMADSIIKRAIEDRSIRKYSPVLAGIDHRIHRDAGFCE